MDVHRRLLSAATAAVLTVTVHGATAPAALASEPWAGGAPGTVGKILWELDDSGRLGVCSGAVVDAPGGSIVATAAHCVSAPDRPEPPAEVWFVPAYDHGLATYREDGWRVLSFHTPAAWQPQEGGDIAELLPHDYAFLTVERKAGRTLQQTHGAHTLAFAPVPADRDVAVLGYPAAAPYDGESLRSCSGPTQVLDGPDAPPVNAGGLLLEDCDLTEGTSGGPWLQGYDPATGTGTVVAVMSAGTGTGTVVGRPFPAEAEDLLAAAVAATADGPNT
ncbi:trypsin-like serine peptidase [Streptomyces harbinensis]|uniref:trypsin-like serine peptidase n=1 Tax=Streptomyces harbinensis TaxID=1176198 RepID=UPI0034DF0590